MDKPRLLLYSDCFTFGGSEYVVINILRSRILQSHFDMHFAYREHREYTLFVHKLLGNESNITLHPLKIWSNDTLFHMINSNFHNGFIRHLIKLPLWLLSRSGLYEWNNKKVFKRFITRELPIINLVHINNGGYPASESCLYFAMCAYENGIKSVFQVNNRATPAKPNKRDKKVKDSVNLFITASENARVELSKNRRFDINKIIPLFNAVETPYANKTRKEICNELMIKPESFIITEVALLEKRKGQIPFLKAYLKFKEINPDLFEKSIILLVGSGEDERVILEFVNENKLGDKVRLLGYRIDYIDIINASDVFALPSLYNEDMPLSILTAMALSKPILSTKVAGIPEEVEDGVNGYLADPKSLTYENDMAYLIDEIYHNKDKLGKASLERFNRLFSRDIYERKLLGIYNDLIQS